jgi:hypothetical protein
MLNSITGKKYRFIDYPHGGGWYLVEGTGKSKTIVGCISKIWWEKIPIWNKKWLEKRAFERWVKWNGMTHA